MKKSAYVIFNIVLLSLVLVSLVLVILSIVLNNSSFEKYKYPEKQKNVCDKKKNFLKSSKSLSLQMIFNNGSKIYSKSFRLFSRCGNITEGLDICSPGQSKCLTNQSKNCCKDPFRLSMSIGPHYEHRIATSTDGKDTHWAYIDMFNKSLTWKVNFGDSLRTGIGCNRAATFYACCLPYGHEYADAQVGFPEFDFMEACLYGWHTTAHQHWDKEGLKLGFGGDVPKRNYFLDENGSTENTYGPGTKYKINTLKEFQATLLQHFDKDLNLEGMTITLTQDRNSISVSSRGENYMKKFGEEYYGGKYGGNVFFWSLWQINSYWLDSPPCPENVMSPGTGPYVFRDLSILSNRFFAKQIS